MVIENKYPINSTVKINSLFPDGKEPFSAGMLEYIGKEATVLEYTFLASENFGWYTLDVDGGRYYWMEEMLDGINYLQELIDSIEIPDNIFNLTINNFDELKQLIVDYNRKILE